MYRMRWIYCCCAADRPIAVRSKLDYGLRSESKAGTHSAANLTGVKRDLAFSVVHLTDMAKAVVDRSLDQMEIR